MSRWFKPFFDVASIEAPGYVEVFRKTRRWAFRVKHGVVLMVGKPWEAGRRQLTPENKVCWMILAGKNRVHQLNSVLTCALFWRW